jgi:hypothetical protein
LKNFTQNCATFLEKNAKMKKKMKCFFRNKVKVLKNQIKYYK